MIKYIKVLFISLKNNVYINILKFYFEVSLVVWCKNAGIRCCILILIFRSPYLFTAMIGLFEIPAYLVTAPIMKRFGRKPSLVANYAASILLFAVLVWMAWNEMNTSTFQTLLILRINFLW